MIETFHLSLYPLRPRGVRPSLQKGESHNSLTEKGDRGINSKELLFIAKRPYHGFRRYFDE